MPAVGNNPTKKYFYYGVSEGKIKRKAPNGQADQELGAVINEWTDKQGNKKSRWEFQHGYLDGFITKLSHVYNEEFKSHSIELNLEHPNFPDEICQFRVPFTSSYFNDFVNRLHNVDYTDMVRLIPYEIQAEKDGVKLTKPDGTPRMNGYLVIRQRGENREGFQFDEKVIGMYNAENPDKGRPEYPGQEDEKAFANWKIDMKDYRIKVINEVLAPKVQEIDLTPKNELPKEDMNPAAGAAGELPSTGAASQNDNFIGDDDEDDMPF